MLQFLPTNFRAFEEAYEVFSSDGLIGIAAHQTDKMWSAWDAYGNYVSRDHKSREEACRILLEQPPVDRIRLR